MLPFIITLALAGTAALVLEVFLPGGILGTLGGLAVIASAVLVVSSDALGEIPGGAKVAVAAGILVASATCFLLSMKYFQRTKVGKLMTLDAVVGDDPAAASSGLQPGMEGVATSPLAPLGTARFGESTSDALSESGIIQAGAAVRITRIESGSVYVVAT